MTLLTDEAERLAEAAANEPDGEETPADGSASAPQLVTVNLGDRVVQLPAEAADDVRRAFDSMAGRYGSELEVLRRSTAQPVYVQSPPTQVAPAAPDRFEIPDPDIIFQKDGKRIWEEQFGRQLAARDARLAAHAESLVQSALGFVQSEMTARENRTAAADYESQLFADQLEKHEVLRDKEEFFWSVFDNVYDDIRHLPANVAYDRAGEIAVQRWNAMGAGSNGNGAPAVVARPATPRVLTGGRSAGGAAAAPPSRASISDRILARQERFLGGAPAAK